MRVWIRGAGDLATGIAVRLYRCGMQIIMTEIEIPTTVRRMAAFSRAVYAPEGEVWVEGIRGKLVRTQKELEECLREKSIAVAVDPKGKYRDWYQTEVLVDAILAKRNLGTRMTDAPLVIGVGPGFTAGEDCHAVIETKRGHTLGRVIEQGSALPNTGIPGKIGGYSIERLIQAETDGIFYPRKQIGDYVIKGEIVACCGNTPIRAKLSGIIRGMLQEDGLYVKQGMKCGDIDPRCDREACFQVSDKALAIGGGVLEAILNKRPVFSYPEDKEYEGVPYFPLFIRLKGRRILVFGAGKIALRRIRTLLFFQAQIQVIAPEIPEEAGAEMEKMIQDGRIQYRKAGFQEKDLAEGAAMVLAATNDRVLNERIALLCKEKGILVNTASDHEMCDFYFPAIAQSDKIIAGIIGTGTNHKEVAAAAAGIRTYLESWNGKEDTNRQPGK